MKIDAEVKCTTVPAGKPVVNIIKVPIDADYVDADEDSICEYVADSDELFNAFGHTPDKDEFEILNLNDLIDDLDELARPIVDVSEDCDYNFLRKQIVGVLRCYFDVDDNGDPNREYDDTYTAQNAVDDIHEIIGDI